MEAFLHLESRKLEKSVYRCLDFSLSIHACLCFCACFKKKRKIVCMRIEMIEKRGSSHKCEVCEIA